MRRSCCATAPFHICGAGASPSPPIARPSGSAPIRWPIWLWPCTRCGRCRRSGPRRASPMIAPPTACSRSTARAIRSTRATRGCEFLAGHGLLFERVDAAGCVAHEPALADVGTPWPAGSTSRATRSATATSSPKVSPPPAPRRGATYHYATAVQRLETPAAGSRASSPTRVASRPTGSWSRWAASPAPLLRAARRATCRSIR